MLDDLVVLPMALSDVDEIMNIELKSFTAPWSKNAYIEELLFNRAAMYYVIKNTEQVIAYGGMWSVAGEGHITNIAVDPAFRKFGVGKIMLKALLKFAKENELYRVFLELRESNTAAHALYTSLGFVEDGVRKKYYLDNGEDAILMSRILNISAE
jgi:ribosomal-protein-alanine N-acetyltransferase